MILVVNKTYLKLVLLLLSFFLNSEFILGQNKSFKLATQTELVKAQYKKEASRIQTLQCNFSQVKKIAALTEQVKSEGQLSLKKPGKMKMEYTKPYSYIVRINNQRIQIKDEKKTTEANAATQKAWKYIHRMMIGSLQGDLLDSRDFTYALFENDQQLKIQIVPTEKNLKRYMKQMVLVLRKKDYALTSLEITELNGDTNTMTFTNIQLNKDVSDEIFNF